MCAFVIFLVGHVTMVTITGFARNMNHIVMGTDDDSLIGAYVGLGGFGVIVAVSALANWLAWRRPRFVQRIAKAIVTPVMSFLLNRAAPQAEFRREDISPFLWANGKVPDSEAWTALAANNFKDYRLKVYGLVENPLELSLGDMRALGKKEQITLHHCIQGWSGIAAWGGLPLAELIRIVRPLPNAKAVVFHSFGEGVALHEGVAGVQYYDNLSIENALNPQTLLAYEMNYRPLDHVYGAPLRLRVENQLGFKMVKWIQAIEFVEDIQSVGKGEGGFAEDYEYFGELANI
jgi:hypothetical protein